MTKTTNPTAIRVSFAPVYKRNGHSRKAIQALKDSGYKFDGDTKVWYGDGDPENDWQGNIAHYLHRGVLEAAE